MSEYPCEVRSFNSKTRGEATEGRRSRGARAHAEKEETRDVCAIVSGGSGDDGDGGERLLRKERQARVSARADSRFCDCR